MLPQKKSPPEAFYESVKAGGLCVGASFFLAGAY